MIAVYYYVDSSPYTMLVLDVKDNTKNTFIKTMIGDDLVGHTFPMPSAEVIILENENIVNTFFVDENDIEEYKNGILIDI